MILQIIEKYKLMRDVLKAHSDNGKKVEDEPTVIEAIKTIVKDLSEILNKEKDEA